MAVTVDDLPAMPSADLGEMRRITDGVLAARRRHRATAVGFVNEDKLEPTVERGARLARHTPDEYVGPRGPSWLHRFRMAKGLPVRLDLEPDPPAWVLDLYRTAQER